MSTTDLAIEDYISQKCKKYINSDDIIVSIYVDADGTISISVFIKSYPKMRLPTRRYNTTQLFSDEKLFNSFLTSVKVFYQEFIDGNAYDV